MNTYVYVYIYIYMCTYVRMYLRTYFCYCTASVDRVRTYVRTHVRTYIRTYEGRSGTSFRRWYIRIQPRAQRPECSHNIILSTGTAGLTQMANINIRTYVRTYTRIWHPDWKGKGYHSCVRTQKQTMSSARTQISYTPTMSSARMGKKRNIQRSHKMLTFGLDVISEQACQEALIRNARTSAAMWCFQRWHELRLIVCFDAPTCDDNQQTLETLERQPRKVVLRSASSDGKPSCGCIHCHMDLVLHHTPLPSALHPHSLL